MEKNKMFVNYMKGMLRNYEEVSKVSARQGSYVFVPANLSASELFGLINRPEKLVLVSKNNNLKEPCYSNLYLANCGRNADGSIHNGYIVIDPVRQEVKDLVDRNGKSKIDKRLFSGDERNYPYFDSDCSEEGFIPKGSRLEDIIKADEEELRKIKGSFEEIADRMDYLIERSEEAYKSKEKRREAIMKKYNARDWFGLPGKDNEGPKKEIDDIYKNPELLEENIELVTLISTRGFQTCPFLNCKSGVTSSKDYIIKNKKTGRELWINQITSHLAREHKLLEKGNKYGITPKEFYDNFMR